MDENAQCNCNDEYITKPCPVHGNNEAETMQASFANEKMVITDEDLSQEVSGTYTGFKFICPRCHVPSIMVNAVMGDFCVKCGTPVLVKSQVVTNYIRERQSKGGQYDGV